MFVELTHVEISSTGEVLKREKVLLNTNHIEQVYVFDGDATTGTTAVYIIGQDGTNQIILEEPFDIVKAKLG